MAPPTPPPSPPAPGPAAAASPPARGGPQCDIADVAHLGRRLHRHAPWRQVAEVAGPRVGVRRVYLAPPEAVPHARVAGSPEVPLPGPGEEGEVRVEKGVPVPLVVVMVKVVQGAVGEAAPTAEEVLRVGLIVSGLVVVRPRVSEGARGPRVGPVGREVVSCLVTPGTLPGQVVPGQEVIVVRPEGWGPRSLRFMGPLREDRMTPYAMEEDGSAKMREDLGQRESPTTEEKKEKKEEAMVVVWSLIVVGV